MASMKNWINKLIAVTLILCGVLFSNGQGLQLSSENAGALTEITEFDDETQYPDADPDWIEPEDAAFLNPLLSPDLSWENVPLQYVKRRKNQVFSAGLFGKRNGWNQGHQNGLFGKRSNTWLEEYMNGRENDGDEAADAVLQYAKRQRWNPNQQTGGLFGKRNSHVVRTYEDMLQSLHDKVESAMVEKRANAAANSGRVRTKSSGQHVFRTGGLFGKRSTEDAGMQRALWPEDEQRRE